MAPAGPLLPSSTASPGPGPKGSGSPLTLSVSQDYPLTLPVSRDSLLTLPVSQDSPLTPSVSQDSPLTLPVSQSSPLTLPVPQGGRRLAAVDRRSDGAQSDGAAPAERRRRCRYAPTRQWQWAADGARPDRSHSNGNHTAGQPITPQGFSIFI